MSDCKLEKIEELKKKLAELEAEVLNEENETQVWEPVGGDYFIASTGDIHACETERSCRLFGHERQTMKQATKARDEMRVYNRLLAYRDEFDPDFEEVWGGIAANYFVSFDNSSKRYGIIGNTINRGIGKVYMSKEVAEELARKLNSGEVVL